MLLETTAALLEGGCLTSSLSWLHGCSFCPSRIELILNGKDFIVEVYFWEEIVYITSIVGQRWQDQAEDSN